MKSSYIFWETKISYLRKMHKKDVTHPRAYIISLRIIKTRTI